MIVGHIGGGSVGVDTGDIGHSLRLRSAASSYLSRTITTDTTSTYFAAIKRGRLGVVSPIFDTNIKFNANDTLTAFGLTTTAVFRDPTSWLFIHVSNGGLYVNGVSYGAITTSAITNPRIGFDGTNYADMHIARIGVVGGASSSYTNFGYQNTEINEWVTKSQSAVKAVVDAGGTNSFMLDFDDATSLTTLGYDKSSKGNNWTLNNFSLTAGSTYDWMLDVPGNSYATLNPLIPSAANITNGNLSSGTTAARGTMNSTTFGSQWFVTAGGSSVTAGVIDDSGTTSTTTVTANKVFAFKMTSAGALSYKNVTDAGSWTSIATGLTGNRWPYSVTQAASWNFGQQPLPEALDSGFKALCQANLPTPAILNPELHFDVVTRAGITGNNSVAGLQFQPDLIWSKCRNNAVNHIMQSRLLTWTGSTEWMGFLETNTTTAEQNTGGGDFQSITSSGYSIVADNPRSDANGYTYVDWLWKAGGAAVTNNAGSISSQVSANTTAGFSIVTYTGTGANATVGHGLGKAPKLVIIKNRTAAWNWVVLHGSLSATQYLSLNSTIAAATDATMWNSTTPTSTVFSLGTNGNSNAASANVAYCFADIEGYSKAFSYTGNGSADGPFVNCGFKPKFVMVKRTDSTGSWQIFDSLRAGYNVDNDQLVANTTAADATADLLDFTATGFKLRSANAEVNASGGTYIFIAFADVPAKYSLAR